LSATVFYNAVSELATVTNTFSVAGVATDPTAVVLVVTSPSGTATTYNYPTPATLTRSGTGVYTVDVSCSDSVKGTWQAVWTGTGAAVDTTVASWDTQPTEHQSLYCTPEALKSRAGITDSLDDREILGVCRAISRWIDQHCFGGQGHFYRHTMTRHFQASNPYCLETPPLVSVATLKTDESGDGTFETTWTTADYQLRPIDAPNELEAEPYTSVQAVGSLTFPTLYQWAGNTRRERVQIAGVWGWPAVPEPVSEAARIICTDFAQLPGMKWGTIGYGDYGAIRARVSGPAMQMLAPYQLHPVLIA
jgi:hypothetical protein